MDLQQTVPSAKKKDVKSYKAKKKTSALNLQQLIRAGSDFLKDKPVLLIGLFILSIIRILISWQIGNFFYGDSQYDEALMMHYAVFEEHFGSPSINSLLKTMSFPWFLNLPRLTGISYNVWVSLSYIGAGLCVYWLFRNIAKNKWMPSFAYLYIIYMPYGFSETTLRIYRNAILVPFITMTIALMLLMVYYSWKAYEKNTLMFILLTLLFSWLYTFTYYIKEDGLWMFPVYIVVMLLCIIGLAFNFLKRRKLLHKCLAWILIVFVPLVYFKMETSRYLAANEKYFGVSEIETRTGGAMGEFVTLVYQIHSDNRSAKIWAPYDAIEKAFDASPTLSSMKGLEDAMLHSPFFNNGSEPVYGDFLGWVLRTALNETGLWTSDKDMQAVFEKVNQELKAAFGNGTLEKETKFAIVSSAGPRSFAEMMELIPYVFVGFGDVLFPHVNSNLTGEDMEPMESYVSILTNQYLTPSDNPYLTALSTEANKAGAAKARVIALIYNIINPLLLTGGLFAWFKTLFLFFSRHKKKVVSHIGFDQWYLFVSIFCVTGVTFVYTFAIAWFSEFLFYDNTSAAGVFMSFYASGTYAMFSIVLLMCLEFLIRQLPVLLKYKVFKTRKTSS